MRHVLIAALALSSAALASPAGATTALITFRGTQSTITSGTTSTPSTTPFTWEFLVNSDRANASNTPTDVASNSILGPGAAVRFNASYGPSAPPTIPGNNYGGVSITGDSTSGSYQINADYLGLGSPGSEISVDVEIDGAGLPASVFTIPLSLDLTSSAITFAQIHFAETFSDGTSQFGDFTPTSLTVIAAPEPAAFALAGLGVLGLALRRRRA